MCSIYFSPILGVGRDEAAPKPAPDALQRLMQLWNVEPVDTVMVNTIYLYNIHNIYTFIIYILNIIYIVYYMYIYMCVRACVIFIKF